MTAQEQALSDLTFTLVLLEEATVLFCDDTGLYWSLRKRSARVWSLHDDEGRHIVQGLIQDVCREWRTRVARDIDMDQIERIERALLAAETML